MNLNLLLISILSGLFAGISPCALAVYPVVLNQLVDSKDDKRLTAILFTIGLAGIYFTVYLLAGTLSLFFGTQFIEDIERIRSYLLILGALFAWLLAWKTLKGGLNFGAVKILKKDFMKGYVGSLLSGFIYGSIITPCNAVFLFTGILPALASKTSVLDGVLMLLAFTVSMSLPILFLGLASGMALSTFKALDQNRRKIEIISVLFLAGAGFYFLWLFTLTRLSV